MAVGGASPWSALLRRVFALDVFACPRCRGRRRLVGAIERFVEAGKGLTRDLGGTATTAEVGKAIASML